MLVILIVLVLVILLTAFCYCQNNILTVTHIDITRNLENPIRLYTFPTSTARTLARTTGG